MRGRILWWFVSAAVLSGLFTGYLKIAEATGISADGAGNAVQAHDMLRGNMLLQGWTVTDVSFYTNELLHLMVAELLVGYQGKLLNFGVALTYTLLVLTVAWAAKGRATGREAFWRVVLAGSMIAVPVIGLGTSVLLASPDHTGTAIPVLLAWIAVQRNDRRGVWLAGLMLTLAQISDPLAMYIGAVPLVFVAAWRMYRARSFKSIDSLFLLAAIASVIMSHAVQWGIRAAGGWRAFSPPAHFADLALLPKHASFAALGLAADMGAFFPDRDGGLAIALGVVHLSFMLLGLASAGVALYRTFGRGQAQAGASSDWLNSLAAVGIVVNLAAYTFSTLPVDLGTARDIVAVAPFSAVLAGRIFGPRLAASKFKLVVAGLAVALVAELGVQAVTIQPDRNGHDIAEVLEAQGLRYGLGSYWYSNNLTLLTGGRAQVIPATGGGKIYGYRWESRVEWYDPARNDARFIVLDKHNPGHGTEAEALAQFGPPSRRLELPTAIVLVYEHNLLVGLPAWCGPGPAPSMAECPT